MTSVDELIERADAQRERFKCGRCPIGFDTARDRATHVRTFHEEKGELMKSDECKVEGCDRIRGHSGRHRNQAPAPGPARVAVQPTRSGAAAARPLPEIPAPPVSPGLPEPTELLPILVSGGVSVRIQVELSLEDLAEWDGERIRRLTSAVAELQAVLEGGAGGE